MPHQCTCPRCARGDPIAVKEHHLLNLILSQADERTRRWLAAYEAYRLENISLASCITGLDRKTIRRGLYELRDGFQSKRIRMSKNERKNESLQFP